MKTFAEKKINRSVYWSVISVVALACSGTGLAQTNSLVATGSSTNVTDLGSVTVVGQLDKARNQIVSSLGATAYSVDKEQIAIQSQGGNAPFNEVILRMPGTAQDGLGQVHVRGEHANLQYRINDVLLPEGISGFGQELDTRFIDSLQLITGALPAQYGFRTAGVVDIQTKSGAFVNGGEGQMYGGSYDTIRPSFEYGGSSGKLNYFVNGSYDHNALGIENPTPSHNAIHDETEQGKLFSYLSYVLDDTSRISFIGSASYSTFQLPNSPGLTVGIAPGGDPFNSTQGPATLDSTRVNENQNEQNYYGVLTYQKAAGNLNYQIAAFARASGTHFRPDRTADLFFDGVASEVNRKIYTGGFQADASYDLNDKHTLRGGVTLFQETAPVETTTTVFNLDGAGNPVGPAFDIRDNNTQHALFSGIYLQDEWKILKKLTINYGARFDDYSSTTIHENQLSPRVNVIYKPTDKTALHAGYARYFTPPALESVNGATVAKFDGTSNAAGTDQSDPVRSERAHYFDAGITQQITKHLSVGVDGYYKYAKNQLDDGLFGQSLILSGFNYEEGKVYGVEFTANYTQGGFETYANVSLSDAEGRNWNSAQFLFNPTDLAYVKNHFVYLDHDQRVTGSFGIAYTWKEGEKNRTRVYVDALYGSGLRTDATDGGGNNIPNGGSVPASYTINLGVEQDIKFARQQVLKARLDVVNLTDNIYQLRDGGGIGVNAAQYGERLGFFGSLSFAF